MAESPSDQSERIEQSGPLCTLQDGKSVSVEENATARVLYVLDQFKRRTECSVIQIFTPVLRTFFSAKNFHQINESPNIFAAETLYKIYNKSR